MNISGVAKLIEEKWLELGNSENLKFSDYLEKRISLTGREGWRAKRGLLDYVGVYVAYEAEKPLYVGSSGKGDHRLKHRIADIFGYTSGYQGTEKGKFYHTLTMKLVSEQIPEGLSLKDASTNFVNANPEKTMLQHALESVRNFYLSKCSFKIVITENIDQARMLEQVFILLLNHPKYNS